MTNKVNDRLDRVEDDLATVTQIMLTLARASEDHEERLNQLTQSVEQLTQSVQQTTRNIERITIEAEADRANAAADRADAAADRADADADRSVMMLIMERMDTLQQQNHQILDYLMRRDRNGQDNGDRSPQ